MNTNSSCKDDTKNSSQSECLPFRISRDIQENIIRPIKKEIHTHIHSIRQESESLDDVIQRLRNAYRKWGEYFYAQNPEQVIDIYLDLTTERDTTRWPDFSVVHKPILRQEL